MVAKSLAIEPIKYNGSVSEFRAWMDKFLSHGGGHVLIPLPENIQRELLKKTMQTYDGRSDIINIPNMALNINYSFDDKDINREVWYVYLYDPTVSQTIYDPVSYEKLVSINRWATILAVEQPPNNTIVEFLDGILFRRQRRDGTVESFSRGQPIGEEFKSFSEFMKTEWEKSYNSIDDKKQEEIPHIKRVTKRGRQRYSDKDKLEALKKWDELDKSIYPIALKEFLRQEFGENPDGSPAVQESTFHGWRPQLRKKNLYRDS